MARLPINKPSTRAKPVGTGKPAKVQRRKPNDTLVPGGAKISRADGVAHMMRLMAADEYVTGETTGILAGEWNISIHTAVQWSCEASRHVRMAMPDEEFRQRIIQSMHEVGNEARTDKQYSTALRSLESQLDARGLLAKTVKVQLVNPLAGLTPEQLRYVAEHGELPEGVELPTTGGK